MRTALEFSRYVNEQIREATESEVASFMNEFSQPMMEMIVSDDLNWKKGGLLSIIILMAADCKDQESVSPRATRYSNLLRKLNAGPDTIIQEVAARAIAMCALANQVSFELERFSLTELFSNFSYVTTAFQ